MTYPEAFDMAARMGVVVGRGLKPHERVISDQIQEAHRRLLHARKRSRSTCNDDAIRLHYCESWFRSLCEIAKALP